MFFREFLRQKLESPGGMSRVVILDFGINLL